MELLTLILFIAKEGMKLWSSERRVSFLKKYEGLLEELENAKNTSDPDYNDDRLMLANQRLCIFLQAYGSELREHAVEKLRQASGQPVSP